MKYLLALLDLLIPRFVTDHVSLERTGEDEYEVIGLVEDFPDDFPHQAVCHVTCFNLFGFGFFPTVEGEITVFRE